ncbi:hypothetical protein G6F46_014178 [Rhizopus delemar]|nr:hypothetical protein G6F46_014178 [Rhizopus delemar]
MRTRVSPTAGASGAPPAASGSSDCDAQPAWMTCSSCATAGPSIRRWVSRHGAVFASPPPLPSPLSAPRPGLDPAPDPDPPPGEDSYTLLTLMPPR